MLREVVEPDLDDFFEHQRDPEANAMALFPAREREAFYAHWRRVLANESGVARTIVADGGRVAGNVVSWEDDGRRYVGYWLGREFWGQGLATRALAELVAELGPPLYAWVASSNAGSIRVLEKCGFVRIAERSEHDELVGEVVEELLFELR